ncbi:MAG: DUF4922 domain-containing protein [Muribaculaceae bacterium]|nr:DUF4922 domain-containing protein [Muribaculaceae bacterium]
MITDIKDFFNKQLAVWPQVAERYKALDGVETKCFDIDGLEVRVQFNPARIRSSAAKVDNDSILARPCFLCEENRPQEQTALQYGESKLLVNPFPIGRFHLTIVGDKHEPQRIEGRIAAMVDLARQLPDCVVFYNGPQCGASAPDHFHFQAIGKDELPIVEAIAEGRKLPFGVITIDVDAYFQQRFADVMSMLPKSDDEPEPKVNLLCFSCDDQVKIVVIPRRNHRPTFYGEGSEQMLVSPASLDLGGIMVAPRREDFDAFSAVKLRELYAELCYTQAELDAMIVSPPTTLRVGILTAKEVTLRFIEGFNVEGERRFNAENLPTEGAMFAATGMQGVFEIAGVEIGIGFHWQRRENQRFSGSVELLRDGDNVVVVNHIDVETYLKSVISSEMSATASLELLKAHAVISRSWVLAQIENKSHGHRPMIDAGTSPDEIVRWYDHDDHTLFDVCADDHCQRYQGITRQTTPRVAEAVDATRGQVLSYQGQLCDARFSKCCGGSMELFSTCWDDVDYPYLQAKHDPFCNTSDPAILGQVLNNYDYETTDFYRWRVEYSIDQLSELVSRKSGIDFGTITALEPLQRGPSGRISRLKIVGTKRTVAVGKELEIRRWLSESHLYSSAFTIEQRSNKFILYGSGWGHGVGLCQIGAAVMGERGYTYREILAHYYPGAQIAVR